MKRGPFLQTLLLAALSIPFAMAPATAQEGWLHGPGVRGAGIGTGAGTNEPGNPNISPDRGAEPDPTYRSNPAERADLPSSRPSATRQREGAAEGSGGGMSGAGTATPNAPPSP